MESWSTPYIYSVLPWVCHKIQMYHPNFPVGCSHLLYVTKTPVKNMDYTILNQQTKIIATKLINLNSCKKRDEVACGQHLHKNMNLRTACRATIKGSALLKKAATLGVRDSKLNHLLIYE